MMLSLSFLLLLLLLLQVVTAQSDFSVTSDGYEWEQSEWKLSTTKFVPGRYQSRLGLANG